MQKPRAPQAHKTVVAQFRRTVEGPPARWLAPAQARADRPAPPPRQFRPSQLRPRHGGLLKQVAVQAHRPRQATLKIGLQPRHMQQRPVLRGKSQAPVDPPQAAALLAQRQIGPQRSLFRAQRRPCCQRGERRKQLYGELGLGHAGVDGPDLALCLRLEMGEKDHFHLVPGGRRRTARERQQAEQQNGKPRRAAPQQVQALPSGDRLRKSSPTNRKRPSTSGAP